jgi:hypothetical protein
VFPQLSQQMTSLQWLRVEKPVNFIF